MLCSYSTRSIKIIKLVICFIEKQTRTKKEISQEYNRNRLFLDASMFIEKCLHTFGADESHRLVSPLSWSKWWKKIWEEKPIFFFCNLFCHNLSCCWQMFATNDFEHVRTKLGLKEQYGGKMLLERKNYLINWKKPTQTMLYFLIWISRLCFQTKYFSESCTLNITFTPLCIAMQSAF